MKNKIFSSLASAAVLSFSSMQAKVLADAPQNIVATQKVASLSQSDMQVLFDGVEANRVAVLDVEEMKATKGEAFNLLSDFFSPIVKSAGEWLADRMFHYWFVK